MKTKAKVTRDKDSKDSRVLDKETKVPDRVLDSKDRDSRVLDKVIRDKDSRDSKDKVIVKVVDRINKVVVKVNKAEVNKEMDRGKKIQMKFIQKRI